MDAALVNSDLLEDKLNILKCKKTSFSQNWFRQEYLGISCCEIKSHFTEKEYSLLIDLLTYYQTHDFSPITSDCPNCTELSRNCSSLPTIIELI